MSVEDREAMDRLRMNLRPAYEAARDKIATAIAQERSNVERSIANLERLGAIPSDEAMRLSTEFSELVNVRGGVASWPEIVGVKHWGDRIEDLPTDPSALWPEDGDEFVYNGTLLRYLWVGDEEGGGFLSDDESLRVWCYEDYGRLYWEVED